MDPLKEMEQMTAGIISWLKEEYMKIRSNRPTTRLVERVKVDYMGTNLELNQVASLSIQAPRDIIVTPWDKTAIPAITKAIESENLGLGIVADSTGVRLTMPDLTIERKDELIKLVKSIAEENRIKMRSNRDKYIKAVNAIADEDEKFRAKDGLQKIVDKFNAEVDSLVAQKIEELNQ